MAECIFNETGMINDTKIQADVATTVLISVVTDTDWIQIVQAAFSTCNDLSIGFLKRNTFLY